ncbi:MAG TPA: hypothetical protein PKD19_02030 [Candidatus Saccharibacteria bacterium]|nr:hypothetical protein [Candidatus Saccharibacteria bacterium]HMR38364.1 hypothetical protein [Candidatus Saccharibacteria bacterium]
MEYSQYPPLIENDAASLPERDIVDVVKQHKFYDRLPYGIVALGSIVGASTAGFFHNLRTNRRTLEGIADYTAYASPPMIALAGIGIIVSINSDRKIQKQLEAIRQAEEELGEPIDIVRSVTKHQESTTVRWYGLDHTDKLSIADIARVRKMSEWSDQHNATIAVGTAWMNDDTVAQLEAAGALHDGSTILGTQKWGEGKHSPALTDTDASELVALLSPDELRTLALAEHDAKQELLARIGNSDWNALYDAAKNGDPLLMRQLQMAVKNALEQSINGELVPQRTSDGGRSYPTMQIHKGRLQQMSYSRHPVAGESTETGERVAILRHLKAPSLEELLQRIGTDDSQAGARQDQLAALYLLLLDDTAATIQSARTQQQLHHNTLPQSLHARVAKDTIAQTKRRERSYSLRKPFPKLKKLGAGLLGIACISGASALGAEASRIQFDDDQRARQYGFAISENEEQGGEENYRQFLQEKYGDSGVRDRQIAEAVETIRSGDKAYREWKERIIRSFFDPEARGNSGVEPIYYGASMAFGDTEPDNTPMFTVTSLGGKSTQGYWPAGSGGTLALRNLNFGIKKYPIIEYRDPSDETIVFDDSFDPSSDADFMIESNTIGIAELPVKAGTEIVYAEGYNTTTEERIPLKLSRNKNNKILFILDTNLARTWYEKNWTTRYYARAVAPDEQSVSYRETSFLEDDERDRVVTAELQEVAAATRRALGLPNDATVEEIYAAIRNNYSYSFTPLKDAGMKEVNDTVQSNASDMEALKQVGQALAAMETHNCNTAQLLALIATADKDFIGATVGFYNDGDDILANDEQHAWSTMTDGTILDPTPSGTVEATTTQRERKDIDPTNILLTGAGALTAALATVVLYRRRKQLQKKYQEISDKQAVKSTNTTEGRRAAALLSQALYGRPGVPFDISKKIDGAPGEWYHHNVTEIGADISVDDIVRQAKENGVELPQPTIEAMRQLQKHSDSFSRIYS